MSGGAVFQEAVRRLMRLDLPDEARRDAMAALEAGREEALLQFFYEAAHEAGHPRDALLARAAGVFLGFAAGNLADDIVDGDCTYLDPPTRLGPPIQFLLHNLAITTLLEGGVDAPSLARITSTWAKATGPHQIEVRTSRWDADLFRVVGEGVAGLQFEGHLRALWAGTALEADVDTLGVRMGYAAHVAEDVRSRDPRFWSMSARDREHVLREAVAALDVVRESSRRICRFLVEATAPVLKAAVVASYYDDKTARILDRYGPGPRVHYHTGVVQEPIHVDTLASMPRDEVRRRLVEAQERVLHESIEAWGLTRRLADLDVVDCGCGLGGTSLLLASGGARVTAVTICAPHVPVVEDLARRAGVSERVTVVNADVAHLEGESAYDAAVAIEASCYFDRPAWFARLAKALKPGGVVCVLDLFTDDVDVKAAFDAAWRTDIGSLASYDAAARAAGLERVSCEDISASCAPFWDLTSRDTRLALEAGGDDDERARLESSLQAHAFLKARALDGKLRHLRLRYVRSHAEAP